MATIWWIRHGPTHARGMLGWSDLPADLGDAAALARLAARLPQGAVVVSSDLRRSVATADVLAGGRRRLPHDPALREMHFGAWELRAYAEIEAQSPELARAFVDDPRSVRPPGGESWAELAARVDAAADRLASMHPGGDVVAVAHFGAILSQYARTPQAPDDVFAQGIRPLSLTRLRRGPSGWRCLEVDVLA